MNPNLKACSSERRLWKIYGVEEPAAIDSVAGQLTGKIDVVSVGILSRFHAAMLDTFSPRTVFGDENCLYNCKYEWQMTERILIFVR